MFTCKTQQDVVIERLSTISASVYKPSEIVTLKKFTLGGGFGRSLGTKDLMPPSFAAFLSKFIALIVCGAAAFNYIFKLYKQPADQFAAFGLGAFATIAGLAAVCYTQAPTLEDKKDQTVVLYAAEKFLHSSILLLQTLVLKFAEQGALNSLGAFWWLYASAETLFYILFLASAVYAFFFIFHGFDSLNCFLWDRYLQRLKG
jgi:hypothetical protein